MTLSLRANDLQWREIDDEIVVLDEREARYLAVQGAGAAMWRLLSESTTRDGLVRALVQTYQIDEARAAADTDAFLGQLVEQGLLAT
jgi:hypothetical protein